VIALDAAGIKQAISLLDMMRRDGHRMGRCGMKIRTLCPFHEEKRPSCYVDEERFHCFACGADGDLFDYIQRRDDCDFREAFRKAGAMAGILPARHRPFVLTPVRGDETRPWMPYRMSGVELHRCVAMAEALLEDQWALEDFANARGWRPETLRGLALDPCLGMHKGKLVYIYPTGAKKRFKPLDPALENAHIGAKFAWMFGRPDAPWRGDRIIPCTETVHITEGESAAIALIETGIDNGTTEIAIAVPGASGWRREWAEMLHDRHVLIWPDADEAGEKMKDQIIRSIKRFAKSIGIVRVPEKEEM